jgi:septum formation protein
MTPLILASGSPRRKEILTQLGFTFEIVVSNIEEVIEKKWTPAIAVQKLAKQKAHSVCLQKPNHAILGSDTIVVLNDKILGKPSSVEHAKSMLTSLSGQKHCVYTGISLFLNGQEHQTLVEKTEVQFREVTEDEISNYILSGEPMDKAGSYGIQGIGARFIQGIQGCFYNVMGLPAVKTQELLKAIE